MTKSEFIQHLEAPHYVNGEDIVEIQEVIQQFPYCQSSQMLLAKAFHVSENLNFERQLKKTAAFAADRKKLHSIIFDENLSMLASYPEQKVFATQEEIDAEKTTTELENENKEVEVKKISLDKKLGSEKETITTKWETKETAQEKVEASNEKIGDETKKLEVKEVDKAEKQVAIEESTTDGETDQLLNQQILSEAINSFVALEVSSDLPELSSLTTSSKTNLANEVISDESAEISGEKSFSEWLSFYKDDEEAIEATEPLWEKTNNESSKKTSSPYSGNMPVKTEFYSPAKMAKLSVQEDDDLVTETLATIYADQGNLDKAIRAFEKLQVKHPEKSSYFASRIVEIQNQLNSID